MRILPVFLCTVLFLGLNRAFAEGSATVTEAVNRVDYGASSSSDNRPAPVGTRLQDGDFLQTGTKSRAELELANQSVARLGADTIFNYSAENNQIDLQAGTILFCKPKDGKQINIKTAAVTAAVVGTTGFVQIRGKSVIFGLVEGHSTITIGGTKYKLTAGQIIMLHPGSPPQIFSYNVPLLVKTFPLITKFHHRLPNQRYIDREIVIYNDLVKRGFIQPPKEPFYLTDFDGTAPAIPVTAYDSAGNSLQPVNPTAPTPPPYNPNGGR